MPRYVPSGSKKGTRPFWFPLAFMIAVIALIGIELYYNIPLFRNLPSTEWAELKAKNTATRWLRSRYTGEISVDSIVKLPIQSWPDIDSSIQFIPNKQTITWQLTHSRPESQYSGLRLRKIEDSWVVTDVDSISTGNQKNCRPGMLISNSSSSSKIMTDKTVQEFDDKKNLKSVSVEFYSPKTNTSHVVELSAHQQENQYFNKTILLKLDSATFYVRPEVWKTKTYHSIMSSLEEAGYLNNRFNNLILDLRGVGGEDIAEAAKLLSQWTNQKGELIYSVEGPKFQKIAFTSTGKTFTEWGKIVLIIDEFSGLASASIAAASSDKKSREIIIMGYPKKERFSESITLPDSSILQIKLADVYLSDGISPYEKLLGLQEIGISERLIPGWDSAALLAAWTIFNNEKSVFTGSEDIKNQLTLSGPIFTEILSQLSNKSFESQVEEVKKIWVSRAFFYWLSLHKGEQWAMENVHLYDPVIFNAYEMIKNKPSERQ
jgi:hypothetical protein